MKGGDAMMLEKVFEDVGLGRGLAVIASELVRMEREAKEGGDPHHFSTCYDLFARIKIRRRVSVELENV